MLDENALIEALQRQSRYNRASPMTLAQLSVAEGKLGFALPPLLRRLYSEVGNGGFAGLLPLVTNYDLTTDTWGAWAEPESVVALYRGLRDNPPTEADLHDLTQEAREDMLWEWPEMLLIICDGGCNIYSCVDCSKPEMPVLLNDNNISWSTFAVEAPSLHRWLERRLSGERLDLDWDTAEKVRFGAARP